MDIDNFDAMAAHMFDPIEPGGEEREMEFAEFLQRVLQMRNGNVAKYNDVVEVNKLVLRGNQDLESKIDFDFQLLQAEIGAIQRHLNCEPASPTMTRGNPLRELEDRLDTLENKVASQFDLINTKLDRLLSDTP